MSSFKRLIDKLDIDESLTRPVKKEKQFHKVKDNVPLKEDYNFMADLLFLPTTKEKYRYRLTVVDLATDEFDMEPIKDKEPKTVLSAIKKIFKRPHLNKPYASIRTDAGKEFKGVFTKYLHNESILHRVALPGRHTQLANVETLNKQLGRLLDGYMNTKELQTGKVYKEWTDILPSVRKELNKIRKKDKKYLKNYEYPETDFTKPPKYNVGDLVYRQLDHPESATGEKQSTANFREGDFRYERKPRKIKKTLYYSGEKPYRYILNGIPNASFSQAQLKRAVQKEELFEVRQLLDKKIIDGKPHYLTWYYEERKKERKKDATYQPESELLKYVPDLVKKYNKKKE